MKIITEGCPNDNEVMMDEIQVKYYQGPDNCSSEDDYQELILKTKDGGGGKYINLSTNEHGWSFDSIEDLVDIIKQFKSLYENTDNR